MVVMIINILLLAVLFVAGLVNLFIYFPTKRIAAWLQSFSLSEQKPVQRAATMAPRAAADGGKERPTGKKVELKKVFGTFDKNNDGYITKKELMESLKNIRLFMTEREVEEMFKGVDANGDGLIDFEEFCILGERLMGGKGKEMSSGGNGKALLGRSDEEEDEDEDDEEDLKGAFAIFDKDKDGLISVDELGLVLSSLGLKEGRKVEDCKEMIRKVDMDGDGMVNFDEFKRMMRSGASLILAQS